MTDPSEIVRDLAPYVGGGWFTRRAIGPSVDVLGHHLASWTESQLSNLERVLSNAKRRLDQQGGTPDKITDRLAQHALDEARTADDELVAEYVGGVVASASLGDGSDAGIPWLSLIRQMPAYAVRSHYLFYASIHSLLLDDRGGIDLLDVQMFVPVASYAEGLETENDVENILSYVIPSFVKEGLIIPTFGQQEGRELTHSYNGTEGFFVSPSRLGIQLFLWGIGRGHLSWQLLGTKELEIGDLLLPLLSDSVLGKPAKPEDATTEGADGTGWSIALGLSSPPKIGRPAISIMVHSEVGTAPEQLQVVVIAPDGEALTGFDRSEPFAQHEPRSSIHVLFPFEFANSNTEWPLTPGTYRVIAQAVRSSTRGLMPEQVAEAEFTVEENGQVAVGGKTLAPPDPENLR